MSRIRSFALRLQMTFAALGWLALGIAQFVSGESRAGFDGIAIGFFCSSLVLLMTAILTERSNA